MAKGKLDIIFENNDIIVVNKPSRLLTVSTNQEKDRTLFHQVMIYLKKKNKNNKLFIVHRLDKDTSGIVLFAKNEKIKHLFQENWDKLIKTRSYVGIVEGIIEKEGTIKSWLKETSNYKVYSSNKPHDGKLAITKYRSITYNGQYTLLQILLETGRKNQIRVHMKDINHPIIGDLKYGSSKSPLKRLGLHANLLEIYHPLSKELLIFETDIPQNFINLFI
ncbi:MAG: RNA pseudouridine synthase [Tenericutes bacterium]|jgi:RluA family pseudouridine synthase|nr:RNA pseudouridine synthase [Mycoplasmatota bacterium]